MSNLSIEGFGEASIHECSNKDEYIRRLEQVRKMKIFTPQAVFFISDQNEPEVTGMMVSRCEIPLYSGGELRNTGDILRYSIGFHLELYTPEEFAV